MTDEIKRRVLLYLAGVGLITVLIAAGLSQLDLKPGIPPPALVRGEFVVPRPRYEPPVVVHINTFFLTILGILLAGMLIYMLYRLFKGVHWKELLTRFFTYTLILVVAVGILALITSQMPVVQIPTTPTQIITPPPVITEPLGPVPPILLWLVGIALALTAVFMGIWMFTSKPRPSRGMFLLGQEAEKARLNLLNGLDLKDAILQCYWQMSQVLQEEQGIERRAFMTTGEFERVLVEQGFPFDPIHQLTRLFEAVRYGHWQPKPSDEKDAIDCLENIIHYARELAPPGKP